MLSIVVLGRDRTIRRTTGLMNHDAGACRRRRRLPGLLPVHPDAQLCRAMDALAADRCAPSLAVRRALLVASLK